MAGDSGNGSGEGTVWFDGGICGVGVVSVFGGPVIVSLFLMGFVIE